MYFRSIDASRSDIENWNMAATVPESSRTFVDVLLGLLTPVAAAIAALISWLNNRKLNSTRLLRLTAKAAEALGRKKEEDRIRRQQRKKARGK
jgi:hypothetical protein